MAFQPTDLPHEQDPNLWSRPRAPRTPMEREPRARAASTASANGLGAAALDMIPDALVLMDAGDGTIVGTNRAADELLASGDGLGREADRLVAREAKPLDCAMSRVRAGELETEVVQLARPSGRAPYHVTVAAAREPAAGPGGCQELGVVLFVHDPDRPRLPSAAWIGRTYKLTRMESEVARDLAAGQSLQEIAKGRFISIQTVRGHLKQVFAKTGTHRQGELIARWRGAILDWRVLCGNIVPLQSLCLWGQW